MLKEQRQDITTPQPFSILEICVWTMAAQVMLLKQLYPGKMLCHIIKLYIKQDQISVRNGEFREIGQPLVEESHRFITMAAASMQLLESHSIQRIRFLQSNALTNFRKWLKNSETLSRLQEVQFLIIMELESLRKDIWTTINHHFIER